MKKPDFYKYILKKYDLTNFDLKPRKKKRIKQMVMDLKLVDKSNNLRRFGYFSP